MSERLAPLYWVIAVLAIYVMLPSELAVGWFSVSYLGAIILWMVALQHEARDKRYLELDVEETRAFAFNLVDFTQHHWRCDGDKSWGKCTCGLEQAINDLTDTR